MNLTLWIFRRSYRQSLTDNRNQFQKIFSVQVIKQQQVHQGQETEYFEDQETAIQSSQVKGSQHQKSNQQFGIVDRTTHFKKISIHVFVHQLQRGGNMIPISDYNAGIILVHRNQYRPCGIQWKNLATVHNGPYLQEAEQHLVPALDYYVKNGCDKEDLIISMPG